MAISILLNLGISTFEYLTDFLSSKACLTYIISYLIPSIFSSLKQVEKSYSLFEHPIYMADCSGMLKLIHTESAIWPNDTTFVTTFESCEKKPNGNRNRRDKNQ